MGYQRLGQTRGIVEYVSGGVTWSVGAAMRVRGQEYVCAAIEPIAKKDGAMSSVAVLRSFCADCGDRFEMRVRVASPKVEYNRRCERHKRPGQRVKTKQPADIFG